MRIFTVADYVAHPHDERREDDQPHEHSQTVNSWPTPILIRTLHFRYQK